MIERDDIKTRPPKISFEWFSRVVDPKSSVPVGLAPLEFLFSKRIVKFSEGSIVHDIGAGTGRSTEYIIGKIPQEIRQSVRVIASEPSADNQEDLRQRLNGNAKILARDAIGATKEVGGCDMVSIINAIHLIPEDQRDQLLSACFDSLGPNGIVIASSTFIEEGIPAEEQKFFNRWMKNMFKSLARFNLNAREVLKRLADNKLKMWPAMRYKELFEKAGFSVEVFRFQTMPCTIESLKGICHYPEFTRHILPGVEPTKAAVIAFTALKNTWKQFERTEDDISPRNTLVIVGRKPADLSQAV